jgi:molybdate transport system substrate-binding protein
MKLRTRLSLAIAALLLAAAGCGGSAATDERAGTGALDVFAASSLTGSFTELGKQFEARHPRANVKFNFGASSALAGQLAAGAPADVVALAAETEMKRLSDADLVGPAKVVATNRLAILVAKGNPEAIRSLADLARPGLTVVLCAGEVPCGALAAQALDRAGVAAQPKSYEANVKAVVSRVTLGEADAAMVYETDVRAAGAKVEGVELAPEQNLTTSYPVAPVKRSPNPRGAEAFISFVLSEAGQRILADAGFGTP